MQTRTSVRPHPARAVTMLVCAALLAAPLAGCVPEGPERLAVAGLGEVLRGELPAPPSDQRCSMVFDDTAFKVYLENALWGDIQTTHRQLQALALHFQCVSAERLSEIALAMAAVLESAEATPVTVQEALAPLVMLLADLGGRFRTPFTSWLAGHSLEFGRALVDSSILNDLGLPVWSGRGIELRTGAAAQQLLDLALAPGLISGNCRIEQLAPLDDGLPRSDFHLYCPTDCMEPMEEIARELGSGVDLALFPEMRELCDQQRQDRRDFAGAVGQLVEGCLDAFALETSGLMACVTDAAVVRRATALAFDTQPQRDFEVRRSCGISWGPSADPGARSEAILDIMERSNDATIRHAEAVESLQRTKDVMNELHAEIDAIEDELDKEAPGWREDPTGCDGCTEGAVQNAMDDHALAQDQESQLMEGLEETEQRRLDAARDLKQVLDDLRSLGGGSYCASDGTGCSDQCGIQDQLAAELNHCIQSEAGGAPEVSSVVSPWNTMPDPRDPGTPSSAAARLAQCLRGETTLESGPITQHHCAAAIRCANGEIPQGIDCDCLPEQQERPMKEDCLEVRYCPSEMSCECGGELPEEFGLGGDLPVPPGEGPDPVPF